MAVSLTAKMSARSITATVSGLSGEHTAGRTFKWRLDGGAVQTEKVHSAITSYTHTFSLVRYVSIHTVTVQISDINDTEQFYSGTVQVADSLSLWSWTASNGSATAEQVKAAYAAVTSKGKTYDFSRLVWNDLADNTLSALVASGLSWSSIYTTLADAKMTAAGDALTAKRFNSLVKNLRYPWMYWACKPARNGYLGRLAVSSGDIVYGAYLLELAHILNVMVDAVGELGAGYADLMRHSNTIAMQSLWSAKLRAPAADHLSHDNAISFSGRQSLAAPVSRHLGASKNIAVSDSTGLSDPHSKWLMLRRVILPTADLALTADNQRELQGDAVILVGTDIVLAPVGSYPLNVLAAVRSGTDVALSQSDVGNMIANIISATRADTVLTGSPSTALQVVLCSEITPDVVLGVDASAHIAITDTPASRIIIAGLSADASAHLAASVSGALLRGDVAMTAYASANMGISNVIRFAVAGSAAYLAAPKSARMTYFSGASLKAAMDAVLRTPTTARMQHDATLALAAQFFAEMSAPVSVRMTYDAANNLTALLSATMYAPASVRMEYIAQNTMAAVLSAVLNDPASVHMGHSEQTAITGILEAALSNPASVHMGYSAANSIKAALDAVLRDPTSVQMGYKAANSIKATLEALMADPASVHMICSANEKIGVSDDHELSDPPSLDLYASAIRSASQTVNAELTPTDSLPLAADIADSLHDTEDVDMSASPSTLLEGGDSGSKTDIDSTIETVLSCPMAEDFAAHSSGEYRLSVDDSISVVVVDFQSMSRFEAALELEGEVLVKWVTQDGSNLYIRGVWSSWNDGDNLQIDTLEFYAPVRDGSNLYIRSAWSSYQNLEEVCIDMDVFYKPYQSDNDLYIRSVNKLWTDGTAANVDRDYFIDPVQTGSNLYIRSDVLGG